MKSNLQNIILEDLKQKLAVDGYAIVDKFLTPQEIDILTKAHKSNIPKDLLHHDCSHSKTSKDISYRRKVNLAIKEIFQPKIENLFSQYKFINGFFLNKINSGKNSELGIHQDTVKTETNGSDSSYRIWCPLIDVDQNIRLYR